MRVTQETITDHCERLQEQGADIAPDFANGGVKFTNMHGNRDISARFFKNQEAEAFLCGVSQGLSQEIQPFEMQSRSLFQGEAQMILFISKSAPATKGLGNLMFDAIADGKVNVSVVAHLKLADGYGEAYVEVPCHQTDLAVELKALDEALLAEGCCPVSVRSRLARLISRMEKGRE